jgi:hypothetical protein
MALVSVMIVCESRVDAEARYFGRSVNEPLKPDFWVSQPHTVIGVFKGSFSHGETWGLPAGDHYFEFNTSAPSSAGWIINVYVGLLKDSRVEDEFTATGWMGSDLPPVRVKITVKEEVVEGKMVSTVSSAPAGGSAEAPAREPTPKELVVAPSSPPPSGVPAEAYAPPPKPWYLHHEPYVIIGGVVVLGAVLWYFSRRNGRGV